ncbi:MAG: hypothetical protein R3D85_02630 [Paracoccaceae bacterium]
MREQDIIQSVAPFFEEIERMGYEVEATSDFDRIAGIVPQTGRKKQTPMMSIDRLDFARSDAFWLILYKDGVPVGAAGAKYVDLEDESFADYLQRTSRAQYSRESDPIARVSAPIRDLFRGRMIYLGELEFLREHRGNLRLLEAFVKVLQGLAAVKWRGFDWIYAIIPEEHLKFAYLYGFLITVPDGISWAEPVPDGRLDSHAFLATEGRHIGHMFKTAKERLLRKRFRESLRRQG